MSFAYFDEPIECPECGYATHELHHATNSRGQEVLMCEECYSDSPDSGEEWKDDWEK